MCPQTGSGRVMTVAMGRSYTWLFWGVAVLGLAIDQGSKYVIFTHLYNDGQGGKIEIVPDVFRLEAAYRQPPERETGDSLAARLRTVSGEYLPGVNRGALFGLGGETANGNRLFAIISFAAAGAIIYWSTRPLATRDRFLCLALGLILAGTLGNLYDRLIFHGVRDFLHWYYVVNWPVFNLADCCLVCGAGFLLVQAFFAQPQPLNEETIDLSTHEPEVVGAQS